MSDWLAVAGLIMAFTVACIMGEAGATWLIERIIRLFRRTPGDQPPPAG